MYAKYEISLALSRANLLSLAKEYEETEDQPSAKLSENQKEQLNSLITEIQGLSPDKIIEEFSLSSIRNLGDFSYRLNLVMRLIEIVESKGGGFWLDGNAPPLWYEISKNPKLFLVDDDYTSFEDKNTLNMEKL
jgi:hypothetical protein